MPVTPRKCVVFGKIQNKMNVWIPSVNYAFVAYTMFKGPRYPIYILLTFEALCNAGVPSECIMLGKIRNDVLLA